jgi:TrmH family RNA methyltransferase
MESGLTVVEGRREVERAFAAGVDFRELYICPELLTGVDDGAARGLLRQCGARGVPVYETIKSAFSKIAYGERAEGILSVCAPKLSSLEELVRQSSPLLVIVEGVEKPGNLGAILRACDGAGADGVVVCDGKTDVFNPNVIRASLGTVFTVKVAVSSSQEALSLMRSKNISVCATSPRAATVYTDAGLAGALAVAVGSEEGGLTDFWSRHADLKVRIPMRGAADSLNVSASTAVLLYEALRQRT